MAEPEMVKAVYDTNVIVSALLTPRRIPWLTLQLFLSGRVNLFVSQFLLEEYRRVLRRPRYQAIPEAQQTLEALERRPTLVIPSFILNVTLDPDDNRVVECAVEAEAHYIVTGNKRHFPFSTYQGIKIVNPREFVSEVAPDWLARL